MKKCFTHKNWWSLEKAYQHRRSVVSVNPTISKFAPPGCVLFIVEIVELEQHDLVVIFNFTRVAALSSYEGKSILRICFYTFILVSICKSIFHRKVLVKQGVSRSKCCRAKSGSIMIYRLS